MARKVSEETKLKISQAKLKNPTKYWLGKKRVDMVGNTFGFKKNGVPWNKGLIGYKANISEESRLLRNTRNSGENNHRWIADRSKVKKSDRQHNDPVYKQWRRQVKNRDGWKCKMSNSDCSGNIVAHHILPWSKFPELRYEVNNGITLCHYHHPRKRNDEEKFAPLFKEMVLNIA